MDNDETQQAILVELRKIRRTGSALLYVLSSGLLLLALAVIHAGLARAVAIVAGGVAVIVMLGAAIGINMANVVNRLKRK